MQMKRKLLVCGILIVMLLSAVCLYIFHPLSQVYRINKSIDIADVRLLMPLEEVTGKMNEEGEYIYGMGGFGYEYESERVRIFFSNDPDSRAYNKVCLIETENPSHSVLGIHAGDSLDKAYSILDNSGFKPESKNYFENGDIYINLFPENNIVKKIRVGFIDRSLSGRVY